jgi:hypothetical protein
MIERLMHLYDRADHLAADAAQLGWTLVGVAALWISRKVSR